MEVQRDTGILAGRTMTQPQQHYDVTDDDFDFIWKNIDSPLVVRDRINVIKTRSNSYQSGRDKVLDILRPEVLTFALLMERKLRKHDKDRGDSYKTTDVDYLLMRLREEVKELHNAIEDDPWDGKGVSLGESVDVGNISMMIGYHDYQFPMDVFIEELVEELLQAGSP